MSTTPSIGYLGIPGTYSYQAAMTVAPTGEPRGYPSFDDILNALDAGHVSSAILPVHNSRTGQIPRASELMDARPSLQRVAGLTLPIEHALIAAGPATDIRGIREIISHEQAFLQSQRFLSRMLPNAERVISTDTATAVRSIVEGEISSYRAAIGSRFAADYYGAQALVEAINDDPVNATTFELVSY